MAKSKASAGAVFEKRGGTLRTSEALAAGIHPRVLYECATPGNWNNSPVASIDSQAFRRLAIRTVT